MDAEEQIPPSLPLLAAQALAQRAKGRNYPSLAKRGQGRFSEAYVFFIVDSLVKDRISDQVRNDNIAKSLFVTPQ